MNTNLEMIKININEDLGTTSADVDKGSDSKISLIETIFQNTIYEQVCDTQPTHSPTGKVYATTRPNTVGMGTKVIEFNVGEKKIPTRFTKEWLQDYVSKFGGNAVSKLKKYIAWDIKDFMTAQFIDMLNDMAEVQPTVTLGNGSFNDEFIKIIAAYNKAASKIATDTKRGYSPYIICSPKVGAAFQTAGQIKFIENEDNVNREYLGKFGRVKVFIDPNATTEYLTVGHFDNGMGGSSIIFSPYHVSDDLITDYSVDESAAYVLARYKFVRNPFDSSENGSGDSYFAKTIPISFGTSGF